jgi:hypothetical protein
VVIGAGASATNVSVVAASSADQIQSSVAQIVRDGVAASGQ